MRIDADFSEDTVSITIGTYLDVLSFPRLSFSVEPFFRNEERWLGADARLFDHVRHIYPFYMQFKRPQAYPDASRAKIIKERKDLVPPLSTSPRTLFFNLREKKPHHSDYQHNILFRLNRRLRRYNLGDAAYVCPLFLRREAYRHHTHLAALRGRGRWPRYAFDLEDLVIIHRRMRIEFGRLPFFAEHITIPPHDSVISAKHSYSFLEDGSEICFHSPVALRDTVVKLSAWLSELSSVFLRGETVVRSDNALEQLWLLTSQNNEDAGFEFTDIAGTQAGFEGWLVWGDFLWREYAIEQYAFVAYV
jgi:hypothetical protein